MATDREAQLLKAAYEAGITSPKELANFMAQVSAESASLSRLEEGFRYTKGPDAVAGKVRPALREGPEALNAAWQEAMDGKPEKLAELMYGGRMGNTEPGDGYKYRGRGYMQLTGKNQYNVAGDALGLDLVNNPEVSAEPENAAKIAIWYWKENVQGLAPEDVKEAGSIINTGAMGRTPNGLAHREAEFREWERALTPYVMERLSLGEVALPITASRTSDSELAVEQIQKRLNALGIHDASGQDLVVDGNRGGPSSRTNQAIAAFQQRFGLDGQISNAELLTATQIALNNPMRNLDQTMRDLLPPNLQQQATRMVDGMPDYLLPGRNASAPHRNTLAQPVEAAALPPLPQVELQPGDHGAAVLALQEHLRLLGATDRDGRALKADRDYGARTKEAVEQFQLWTGRETTGIADKDTLQALETQAQFVSRQRAQGVPPGDHMADNLKPQPMTANAGLAADPRLPSGQETVRTLPASSGLQPFSDPNHPQHALYTDVQQRFQAKGHTLSEAQLSVLTGQMHAAGATPDWRGDVTVRNGTAMAMAMWPPGMRADIDLTAPAPSVQDTMKNFQADQQSMAQSMEMLRQQQATAQEHGHGLSR